MTSVEIFTIIASMLGGLALFLFGMSTMSDSLTEMSGGILNRLMGFITKNRFTAFLFGTAITAVVQSSSAITVLSVGLVNSRIIQLAQAAGLIIGANLGTTATAWLLSMNAIDGESLIMTVVKPSSFSPFLGIIGVAMMMFARSEKKKTVGKAILGFSVMMIGMNLMGQAVAPLKEVPVLQNMLVGFTNPVLGFLFAMLFTMLIQSSDATVGIIQAFALSMGITYGMAIPLVCGAQTGTCITALLSSLGTSNSGKRTALVNLFYNLFKTIPFMVVFYLLNMAVHFSFLSSSVGGIGIPLFHSLINLAAAAVWLPLSGVLISLVQKIIPPSGAEKEEEANKLSILDPLLLSTPEFALEQADKAVSLLAETAGSAFADLSRLSGDQDVSVQETEETLQLLCNRSRQYYEQIRRYLTDLSALKLSSEASSFVSLLMNSNLAFSRIGVLCLRILEMYRKILESDVSLTEDEKREFHVFGSAIGEIIEITIMGYATKAPALSTTVQLYREMISEMSEAVKKRRLRKMHDTGDLHPQSTTFTEMFYTEEQLLDYCEAVADALLTYSASVKKAGGRPSGSEPDTEPDTDEKRRHIRHLFEDKYRLLRMDSAPGPDPITAGENGSRPITAGENGSRPITAGENGTPGPASKE